MMTRFFLFWTLAVAVFMLYWAVQTAQAVHPLSASQRHAAVRLHFLHLLKLSHTPPNSQVDHWIPLHCGGPDTVANMRLTSGAYMKEKEQAERNCKTLEAWKREHPCVLPGCYPPEGIQ